jgi:hypothetical protein
LPLHLHELAGTRLDQLQLSRDVDDADRQGHVRLLVRLVVVVDRGKALGLSMR